MKLINLIIGKMFEEELEEIKELLLNDVANKQTSIESNFKYIGDAESFMYEKKKSKELDRFKIFIEEDILNLELDSYDHPIHVWQHNNKIVEIIDNALDDGLYADDNNDITSTISDIYQDSISQNLASDNSNEAKEDHQITFNITVNNLNNNNSEEALKTIVAGLKRLGLNIKQ